LWNDEFGIGCDEASAAWISDDDVAIENYSAHSHAVSQVSDVSFRTILHELRPVNILAQSCSRF
jgi:hypothetical protein